MDEDTNNGNAGIAAPGRRNAMKIGVGAALTMMTAQPGSAQQSKPTVRGAAADIRSGAITQTGWTNDANRISGNGPMDETTRQIVSYVHSFSEANLTPAAIDALGNVMIDGIASLIAGFESEPARIGARMARTIHSDLKSTVLGYGVTTTPEMAGFVNGCMLRHTDFNDLGPGGHTSDIIPGILAIGEALHSSGTQMLAAVAVGYEVCGALMAANPGFGLGWDSYFEAPAVAMGAGKLMGLNEDQLANALSLALVPHMPMNVTHVGALSHWKGCHSSEAVKCAVWATLLAREGMTGPAQPFEARNGLFDHIGPYKQFNLPMTSDGKLVVQQMDFKRTPSEGNTQAILESVPAFRAWAKPEDVASIHIEMTFAGWQEIADPPKWDPRNRETADHSMPYIFARALLSGEIYLDSFNKEKYMDPAARRLMDLTTVAPHAGWRGSHGYRVTMRTKSGGEMIKEWVPTRPEDQADFHTPMTHEDIVAKFKRVCAYHSIADAQRDKALAEWSNLRAVRDIAEPMKTLAKFGKSQPL